LEICAVTGHAQSDTKHSQLKDEAQKKYQCHRREYERQIAIGFLLFWGHGVCSWRKQRV